MIDLERLHHFIISAKAATYVGDGKAAVSCREGSHDLAYNNGDFSYLDSYFGGDKFIGQEVVYNHNQPVWGMNYYGRILMPEKITAPEAGAMIKASLSRLYASGRFLGGWVYHQDHLTYHDTTTGDLTHFTGYEWIEKDGDKVYELIYQGGLIL